MAKPLIIDLNTKYIVRHKGNLKWHKTTHNKFIAIGYYIWAKYFKHIPDLEICYTVGNAIYTYYSDNIVDIMF